MYIKLRKNKQTENKRCSTVSNVSDWEQCNPPCSRWFPVYIKSPLQCSHIFTRIKNWIQVHKTKVEFFFKASFREEEIPIIHHFFPLWTSLPNNTSQSLKRDAFLKRGYRRSTCLIWGILLKACSLRVSIQFPAIQSLSTAVNFSNTSGMSVNSLKERPR